MATPPPKPTPRPPQGAGPLPGARGATSVPRQATNAPERQPSRAAVEVTSGIEWKPGRFIPENEVRFEQTLGGGPGGQHVNKTATRVTLIWKPESSIAFSSREIERLVQELSHRLTAQGEVRLRSASQRSAHRNKEECVQQLTRLVRAALTPRRKRVATRPSRASKRKRLENKSKRSQTKQRRQRPSRDD